MIQIFELAGKTFEITKINMVRALMGKVDNIKEQMGNICEEKILRIRRKC